MTDRCQTDGFSPSKVAAVVVTYNSSKHIEACIESLVAAGVDQILVYDNGSTTDDARDTCEACKRFAEVQFQQSGSNLGFGSGVNQAVKILEPLLAPNDCLWIINPDTVVDATSVSELQQVLRTGRFDIVSPRITTGPNATAPPLTIWFDGGFLDLQSVATQHLRIGQIAEKAGSAASCTFLTGCAMFMRLSTWKKLEGFSDNYFLYWEDADLSWRASQLGLSLGVIPSARVWHAVGGSGDSSGKSSTYYYYMQRNRVLFAHRIGVLNRLWTGRGLLESAKLTARPLRQHRRPISKFLSGLRGIFAGVFIALRSR